MDPVTVFNALYDTKCLKFGQYDLKSGLKAPYYINLRRLPLYPKLMDAIVTQVSEKFLSGEALVSISAQLCRQNSLETTSPKCLLTKSFVDGCNSKDTAARQISVDSCYSSASSKLTVSPASPSDSDSDSQLEDEVDLETSSQDEEWEKLGQSLDPILCGVPYGAVPLGAAIAYKSQLPFLMERKDSKDYGDQQCLMADFTDETRRAAATNNYANEEPLAERRQRVILIEDVICSGESILDTVRRLERRNLKVEFVICVVDREENGINLLLKKEGIRVLSLYKISAILRILEATGRITHEQFVKTRAWITKNQFVSIGVDPSKVTTTSTNTTLKAMPKTIEVATN